MSILVVVHTDGMLTSGEPVFLKVTQEAQGSSSDAPAFGTTEPPRDDTVVSADQPAVGVDWTREGAGGGGGGGGGGPAGARQELPVSSSPQTPVHSVPTLSGAALYRRDNHTTAAAVPILRDKHIMHQERVIRAATHVNNESMTAYRVAFIHLGWLKKCPTQKQRPEQIDTCWLINALVVLTATSIGLRAAL
eukprot:scaffold31273_cov44-Prasinocladus_malaysianus.AAC.1